MLSARILLAANLCIGASWCAGSGDAPAGSWRGIVRNDAGAALAGAEITIRHDQDPPLIRSADTNGNFTFRDVPAGTYSVLAVWRGHRASSRAPLAISAGHESREWLEWTSSEQLVLHATEASGATGGERLQNREVAGLPLNKRDFSQLLLLAAGTQTDTNGAANFTQQFAVNGQRGTSAVFAMDGIYTSDPEMGGATFSNFNVDAIEELRADSGAMPAEVGAGAASFTNVITKSGTDQIHGDLFEFVRNAAFDARNFFDRRSLANPGRIPPFTRNEFGFTIGGPVVLPHIYNGHNRTFYFGEYQGFRQVLGTTQVIPVPTPQERQGKDTTAFPGDALLVPVDPRVVPILERYPMPNDPQGPFGARTYATSSKVRTFTDQFSIRLDHRISDKAQLFARFTFDNTTGPLTNPSQTAIDPTFAIRFFDNQRNFGLTYTRTVSPRLTLESSIGYVRSTPFFPTINHTQPALKFVDGLYEAFNAAGGTVAGAYGNVFQARQNISYTRGGHTLKFGFDGRWNRDTTVFGLSPNGEYSFAGGAAYSPVGIRSLSGRHDIRPGDPLPDALSGLLTATPFSYSISVSPSLLPQGDHIGESGLRRGAYNFYFQDTWKPAARLTIAYGVRYELNTPFSEPTDRTSSPVFTSAPAPGSGVDQALLANLRPAFKTDWNGWGPRLSLEWRATSRLVVRAAGAITTILPNLFTNDFVTGGPPFVLTPYLTAAPGSPIQFENAVAQFNLPAIYTPQGQALFGTGRTTDIPPNSEMNVQRFEDELAAATPGHQIRPLTIFGNAKDFRNGYTATYTAGLERRIGDVTLNASYVATVGVGIAALSFPNSYGGADPAFAPYTRFDDNGHIIGGFGPEFILTNRSHSTFHSLQAGLQKTSARAGLGFQLNYTFSKSLDDTSSVLGGFSGASSGVLLQSQPQNPGDTRAEKGPSTFDVTHVLALSLVQELPFGRWWQSEPWVRAVTSGWQLFSICTLTSGSPFSVYSGIQQTGAGSDLGDRPDQIGKPSLSTSRVVREDYLGEGSNNPASFYVPIDIPGGTGPNQGRFGTLGRNTFRGPAFHDFDFSLTKDTVLAQRANGESVKLQFRAEFFNLFNLVNFGLPANIVQGPGFGVISRTAGASRQIQFSLKLLY